MWMTHGLVLDTMMSYKRPGSVSLAGMVSCMVFSNVTLYYHYYAVLWLVFTWSSHPWSPMEITPVLTTFCGYYPSVHYFYVPWLIMTSQWLMMLVECPIVAQQWEMRLLGTSIVTPQWLMMLLCVHNMASQWIVTLLGTSFVMYYYTKLWYCCFTSKPFKIVHINHSISISNQ